METLIVTTFALVMYLGFATYACACLFVYLATQDEDTDILVATRLAFREPPARPHVFAIVPPSYETQTSVIVGKVVMVS